MTTLFYPGQTDYIDKLNLLYNYVSALTYINVGTALNPIYEVQANVIPRTNTLVNLKTFNSGSGELTSATDTACIVQLNGSPGTGTYSVYSPMAPGTWNDTTFTFKPISSTGNGNNLIIKGGATTSTVAANGGNVNVSASPGILTGAGGGINIFGASGGTSGSGGDINIGAGGGRNNVGGSVNIYAGSSSPTGSEGYINLGSGSNSTNSVIIGGNGTTSTLGFYDTVPIAKPTVSGSKASGAALASLLVALSALGLIDTTGVTA
jgi:hypothetical protein